MIPWGRQHPTDPDRQSVAPDGRPHAEQPRWRRDFPIDWAQDEYVSRRDLVKFLVLTSAAFTAGQFWIGLKRLFDRPTPTGAPMAVTGVDDIPVGGAKTFTYPEVHGKPRLLVRTGEDTFVAYDQACTHLMCPVVPAVAEGRIHCPCHNGWFDLETGQPVAGPPQRRLPRVLLEVRGGTVYATGVEEPTG